LFSRAGTDQVNLIATADEKLEEQKIADFPCLFLNDGVDPVLALRSH
jgi:hypothetical protein